MGILGGIFTVAGALACCGVLFVVLLVVLLFWYLKSQRDQQVSVSAPAPQIHATIEHPSAAAPPAPASPAPVVAPPVAPPAPPSPPAPPEDPAPRGTDV